MYPVLEVAQYIIWYCDRQNYIVSNLKLQKILYYIQAEFLVVRKTACFLEAIEAWTIGPVVPKVYHKYGAFGNPYIPYVNEPDDFSISYGDRVLIGDIVDACAPYTTSQLTEITRHQSPWMDTYHAGHRVISEEAIAKFFST